MDEFTEFPVYPEFLTVAETAHILRCHRDTIRSMIERGDLAAVKIGHAWRIDADSLPQPTRAEAPIIPPAKPRQMTGELVDAVARIRAAS